MADLLTEDQITERAQRLADGWSRDGDALVAEGSFADFAAAIARLNEIAALAERANHHPDLALHDWNRLGVRLSTHSAGGLTSADFNLAERIGPL